MKGLWIGDNALGFTTIKLHYSASPDRDIAHPDPNVRAKAQEWLFEAKRSFADESRWQQEMEISWWTAQGRRVYPEFLEHIHAPMALLPNPRKVIHRAWDFGWITPACLIATVDNRDRLLILREIVGREETTRDFAQRVVSKCAEWYPTWSPGWQDFCDPAGQQVKSMESERNEKRDVEVLNGLGIYPSWEYGWSRKDGRALVHQLLVLRTDNSPSIYVDPHGCPTLVRGFLGKYVFPERKDGTARDEPEEANHPWADVHAALRYLATGLYSALGLRRFKHQPVMKPTTSPTHGYGTPVRDVRKRANG